MRPPGIPALGGLPRAVSGPRLCVLAAAVVLSSLLLALLPADSRGQAGPGSAVDEAPGGAPYAAGELLVAFESGASERAAEALARGAGAEVEKTIPEISSRVLVFPELKNEQARQAREQGLERARQALERSPAVRSADYNYLAEPLFTPNDPLFEEQWGLEKIRAPRAWDVTRGGNVRVGVVDSGIDRDHPDLGDKIIAARDFTGSGSPEDDSGHGTHVAGIAAASTNNDRGVAGACPECNLLVAKSVDGGSGTYADIADGIIWTAFNGAEAINLSLGGTADAQSLEDAVDYAWNKGAVVTAAAGNTGSNTVIYPAAYENALGTAATNEKDRRAGFSTYGQSVDIAAPGTRIESAKLGGGYELRSGTSMAAPHVAGLAGLLAAQGRNNVQTRDRMESTAVDLGSSVAYGAGRIDAAEAVGATYTRAIDNSNGSRFRAPSDWATSSWNEEKTGKDYRVSKPESVASSAKFKVDIPRKGKYKIYGRWPSHPRFNDRTRFLINTTSGWKARAVDQRKNGARWVYLGAYEMEERDSWSVRIPRRTNGSGFIIADALLVKSR